MTNPLNIGWASGSITPSRPVMILGQMYQRVSEYVHDPITATALALDSGDEQALLLSMDMTEVSDPIIEALQKKLSGLAGLKAESLSISATHTHNASGFYSDFMRDDAASVFGEDILPRADVPDDILDGDEALEWLTDRLYAILARAWESRRPGGISCASDYAAVGFNRRPVFGRESVMYGDCSRPDFAGFEGTVDHEAGMLYTWDAEGSLTGVAVNIACPSQVYELHRFITADYWGYARKAIRRRLGNIHVLPLCGAAGDQAPIDLVKVSKWNRQALLKWGGQTGEVFRNFDMTLICQGIAERIAEAAARGYDEARSGIEYTPAFAHRLLTLDLPLRLVSEEDYRKAAAEIEGFKKRFSKTNPMTMADVVRGFEPQGDVLRFRLQQKTQVFRCVCHVLRLGETALATNPFELFTEYGLRIKARCRARQTMLAQLSNGLGGYLPTRAAISGGSYSSKPASTLCGPEGGEMLVEQTIAAIDALWRVG